MSGEIRPISVQKVISLLKKAGHPKAEGTFLSTFTDGFVVRKQHHYPEGDTVRVSHRDKQGDYGRPYDDSKEIAAYRASLESSGVVIIPDDLTDQAFLCVGIKESATGKPQRVHVSTKEGEEDE